MVSQKARERMERQGRADVNRMCQRYKDECKELGMHIETEEERKERLAIAKAKKAYADRYRLKI